MPGYSSTPLWKKLGYKDGCSAVLQDEPADYTSLLSLPREVSVVWEDELSDRVTLVHLFAKSAEAVRAQLTAMRTRMRVDCAIWISWPKKSSKVATDITEDVLRNLVIPMGLVDIKVCAVDDTWSGLKVLIRKEQR